MQKPQDEFTAIRNYTAGDPLNDDAFTIYPVNTSSTVYVSSDYESADVKYIVGKHSYDEVENCTLEQVLETVDFSPAEDPLAL